jgi:hypothetical protein
MHDRRLTSRAIRLEVAARSGQQCTPSAIEEDEMKRVTRILALGGSVSVLLGVTLAFCTAGTPDVVHVTFPPSW